jgi:GTP cyclohydrolase II
MSVPAPLGGEPAGAVDGRPRVRAWVDTPIELGDGVETTARMFSFRGLVDSAEHLALGLGPYRRPTGGVPLVRLHSECLTGDVFGSRRCDCGPQLGEATRRVHETGGYVLYLRQEGRGIGLYAKLEAYRLQDHGLDTFEANRVLGYDDDPRNYRVAAEMLNALDVHRIDLLTGNPAKTEQLTALGIDVRRVLRTDLHSTPSNLRYLRAKAAHGHRFSVAPGPAPGPGRPRP